MVVSGFVNIAANQRVGDCLWGEMHHDSIYSTRYLETVCCIARIRTGSDNTNIFECLAVIQKCKVF